MSNVLSISKDTDAAAIGELYRGAKGSMLESANRIIQCGRRLSEKKAEVGHGAWSAWLKDNEAILGFTQSAANRMMRAANSEPAPNLTEADALKISREAWGHEDKPKTKSYLPVKRIANTYVSPEIDDEDEEDERTAPNQLPTKIRIRGLVNRAKEATEMAEADNMAGIVVSSDVCLAVHEAARAWTELLSNLVEEDQDV